MKHVMGVSFVYLDRQDVVRHRLVKDIIDAYEKFNASGSEAASTKITKDTKRD